MSFGVCDGNPLVTGCFPYKGLPHSESVPMSSCMRSCSNSTKHRVLLDHVIFNYSIICSSFFTSGECYKFAAPVTPVSIYVSQVMTEYNQGILDVILVVLMNGPLCVQFIWETKTVFHIVCNFSDGSDIGNPHWRRWPVYPELSIQWPFITRILGSPGLQQPLYWPAPGIVTRTADRYPAPELPVYPA